MTKKSIQLEQLQLGVCYYPEHWPEELWPDDFRRMKDMNITVIRVAEFAWSIFEPEEGVFRFDFFDRVLDEAHRHGLQVIMGTPTATPPAWLTHRYPEVLNATQEGVVYQHGQRRHYNYSSRKYRELCARIVTRMVEHYGGHPAVVGWQIDNELNCEVGVFYAEADHLAFRAWLKDRYGTLEELNRAWGTVFWSQTYSDWEQVFLPLPTPSDSPNPHQVLDEKRFISDNAISFAKLQADLIRELAPAHHWVTTNGLFGHLDNHRMTDELLDFYSYDSYPQFSSLQTSNESKPLRDRGSSFNLSQIRSISPQFCIMEHQSGPGGWVNRMEMAAPRPGQVRLWSYQSILHGTDLLVYFRWRTATMGTEIYWHGINNYDNRDNRRVREVAQIGRELASLGNAVVGGAYEADVAIIRDYDNLWDGEFDKWHGPLEWQSVRSWFKQLQYRHIPVDVLYMREQTTLEELLRYKVLVYPHAAIMTEETAKLLTAYAEHGGTVLFGARTGYKDKDGQCPMQPMPGPVAELCGITVEDYTLIKGTVEAPALRWSDSLSEAAPEMRAIRFNDILKVEDPSVEIIAEYDSDYYEGEPALTRRQAGEGQAWYYGAAYDDPVVAGILDRLKLQTPSIRWFKRLPEEVEFGVRSTDQNRYIFLLNYNRQAVEIELQGEMQELLSGKRLSGRAELPGYGVYLFADDQE